MKKVYTLLIVILFATITHSQTIGIPESANNETAANAQLIPNPAKVRGSVFPNADVDWYKFVGNPGDRVYAAVMTSFSASASTDSQIRLFGSDGTTLIEFDEDDGALGGLSSTIAGAVLPAGTGTYYLQVKHFSATNTLRPYDLYFKLQTGAPTPEVEPNDNQGTANPMPLSGWVSGSRDPALATEQDWFSVTLLAGETVFISMDLDPERDNVQWNGRLGFALFGDASNQILVVDDASVGSVANPLSEFFVFTAKNAGTYYVFVDAASAATGGPTATYHISYTKFVATSATTPYDSYVSTDVPKVIGPGAGFVTSTITVPANTKRVKDVIIRLNLDHALMADIDAELMTPEGNTIALFNDIGATATGGQTQMDLSLCDNNATPFVFTVVKGVGVQPELNYPLSHLRGMQTSGVWTLTLRDDLTNTSGGNLLGWSIEFLEDVPPNLTGATAIVNEDFEAGDAGFTHSGVADEWERGIPATVATTTSNPVAAFNTANSGVNCWKTDLDNTYEISSNQTLLSPIYVIPATTGSIWLSWAMKFQMESATFDKITIRVYEEGNPTNSQILYQWMGATMTAGVGSPTVNVPISTPWGVYWVDISAFIGKSIRFEIVLSTDSSINFGGLAFDDIKIYDVPPPCSPSSITLGAFPVVCSGTTSTNLPYTATTGSPNVYSIDYDAAAEAAGFVDVANAALTASPIVLVVPGAAAAATYNATITVQNTVGGCVSPAVPFTVTVTACVFPCVENFDAVGAPALPLGWSATTGGGSCGGSTPWVTTNAASASAPNAAFTNDPSCVSDEYLDTRPYAIAASGQSRLIFQNNYNLENNFDGMVLEMSLNAGPFVDIITTGGTFVTGGYNSTISSSFGSPISGRQAWTGNSGGFINSSVNLPVSANGQNAVFRFRRATDNSVASTGVYVDDVHVIQVAAISYAGTPYCSNGGTASVTLTGSTGGTYSSTPGLSIDGLTGAVTLGTSTAGSYVVTYSLSSGVGCPLFTTTAPITITQLPAATISYTANPYCQGGGTANVTRTGTAGGTYSASPAGLSINAATGAVTLGTSTPGTYTVTYTIAAAAGCPAVMTTTSITVNSSPVITCPANITVNSAPGMCGAIVTYPAATATGTPTPTITYSQASGTFFPVGVTTITATASNTCGTVSCTFTVTVIDNIPPVITCPADMTVSNTPGLCSGIATFNLPVVTDNCQKLQAPTTILAHGSGAITVAGNNAPGGYFFDITNNSAFTQTIGSVSVRFGSTAFGAVISPAPVSVYQTTSATTYVGNQTNAGAWTTIGTNIPVTVAGPNSEFSLVPLPGNGITLAPGASKGIFVFGTVSSLLYNSGGNSSFTPITNGVMTLTPGHAIGGLFVAGGFSPRIPNIILNYYQLTQTAGLPSGSAFPVGTTTNTFVAKDDAGNTASCSFTITVNDTQIPTITCPAPITVTSTVGTCNAIVTYAGVASDNCPGATVQLVSGPASGAAFPVGATTVTLRAIDAAGNVSPNCSFIVTVLDAQLPMIAAQPANRTVCAGASATFSVTAITAPSAGGPLSYQWQLWNGSTWNNITGATASSYTVSGATVAMNTNSYRVVVTGLCTVVTSTHATLYVNPLPTINLTTSIPPNLLPTQMLTITATTAPSGGSYVWFKNGVVIAGASGSTLANLTVSDIGTYRVVYTDPNGCVATSSDVVITGQPSDNLYVYPVPNNGVFNVRFYNAANEQVTLRVIDAKGSEVYRRKVQTTIPYTTINVDLSSNRILTSGVYVVEMRRSDGSLAGARRIIVYK